LVGKLLYQVSESELVSMSMNESLQWWWSLRKCASFTAWMREQYSTEELRQLVVEATDADLLHLRNPLARDTYIGGYDLGDTTVYRLYKRYGDEIWSACYRAAARGRPSNGYDLYRSWLEAFSTLSMAFQVIKPSMFEEMLVRHALAQCAKEILAEDHSVVPGSEG
jgi:hypothetical protein